MPDPLLPRLQAARHAGFVGREEQRRAFEALLHAEVPPAHLVYVHGPAGIGKTTLLNEYAFVAAEAGWPAFEIDLRDAEPSLEALLALVAARAPFDVVEGHLALAADAPAHFVVLLDTCEAAGPPGDELLRRLLAVLPPRGLVVAAGRGPGGPRLHTDAGVRHVTWWQPLPVLAPDESRTLLDARRVPAAEQGEVMTFAAGHPLALALVADAYEQNPGFRFAPTAVPDVTAALLHRFLDQIPDALHRHALYALGLPLVADEPLLRALLDHDDVYDVFEWLRARPFVESTARGLQPHELVRNALVADLRWRNPALFETLHARARRHYTACLARSDAAHARVLADYLFLFRDNALVRPLLHRLRTQWAGRALRESAPLSPSDRAAVGALVALYEGAEAARWAAFWMDRQPGSVHLYRDDAGALAGCLFAVRLDASTACADPAVCAAQAHMEQHGPLRAGETALHFRFWMSREHYQRLSPEQCLAFADTVRLYLTTPRLTWTFLPCAQPSAWDAVLRLVGLQPMAAAAYASGRQAMQVHGLDWRGLPPPAWLEAIASQGLRAEPPASAAEPLFTVLTEDAFAEAVKAVLQGFTQPRTLRTNPLVGTRLLRAHPDPDAAVETLRGWIAARVEAFRQAPRQAKLARALTATYLDPAPTQERAADDLGLPFSTYRRHLRAGLDAVTSDLWSQELAGLAL